MKSWREGIWLCTLLCISLAMGACTKPQATKKAPEKTSETNKPAQEESGTVDDNELAGELLFSENFEGADWRSSWSGSETAWQVEAGRLKGKGDKNGGLWWTGKLPQNAKIEFDAWAESAHGDLKVELYGEQREHQSGYVVILGGWKNRISVIARKDEHGKDRIENRKKVASPGQRHRFKLIREGKELRCYVDGERIMSFLDEAPLNGFSFGFSNWEAPVAFDNLSIYELTPAPGK